MPLTVYRVCGSSGEWEGGSPLCHPITCGQPPLVENTLVDLLNSSTTWLSLALFSCKPGYSNSIPGRQMRQFYYSILYCLENYSILVSDCSTDGSWTPPHLNCYCVLR